MPESQVEDAEIVEKGDAQGNIVKELTSIPTALGTEDRLQFALYVEKLTRIEAQISNLRTQLAGLDEEHVRTSKTRDGFGMGLRAKYKLTENDKIVTETGEILRAPVTKS